MSVSYLHERVSSAAVTARGGFFAIYGASCVLQRPVVPSAFAAERISRRRTRALRLRGPYRLTALSAKRFSGRDCCARVGDVCVRAGVSDALNELTQSGRPSSPRMRREGAAPVVRVRRVCERLTGCCCE